MIISQDGLPPTSMILIFMNNVSVSYVVTWSCNTTSDPLINLTLRARAPCAASPMSVLT